jgi:hypothetical protein
MTAVVILLLLIGGWIGVAVWRGRQVGELARRGVAVTGRVDRKFRSGIANGPGSRGRRLAFVYTGPDGREYRRTASVPGSRWSEHEEGGPIELVCLPDKLGVSAPAWMIEAARAALRKRAL